MRTMLRSFAITGCAAAVTIGLVPLASAAHAATDPTSESSDGQVVRSVVPAVDDQQTEFVQTENGLEQVGGASDEQPGDDSGQQPADQPADESGQQPADQPADESGQQPGEQTDPQDPQDEVVTPDPEASDGGQTKPVTPVKKPVKKPAKKPAKKRIPLVYSGGRVMTVGRTVTDRATIASYCPRTPVRGYVYSTWAWRNFNGLCRRSVAEAYSATAARAIVYAFRALGSRYSQGNRAGVRSYDCSSLVSRAYYAAGNKRMMVGRGWWPTTYSLMGGQGGTYRVKGGRAGDIVFPNSGHVALRIAGGFIIHASNPATGIKLSPIYSRVASYRAAGK